MIARIRMASLARFERGFPAAGRGNPFAAKR